MTPDMRMGSRAPGRRTAPRSPPCSEHGLTNGYGSFWPGYDSLVAYYPDYGAAVSIQVNSGDSRMRDHLPKLAGVVLEALADTGS